MSMKIRPIPLSTVLLVTAFTLSLNLLACKKQAGPDPERDSMVRAFGQVRRVLMKELSCSSDRVLISSNLYMMGVTTDNRDKIKAALDKELGFSVPERLLLEKRNVGDIVRFAAERQISDAGEAAARKQQETAEQETAEEKTAEEKTAEEKNAPEKNTAGAEEENH